MASVLGAVSPTRWGQTLAGAPVLDTRVSAMVPALVRRWQDIPPAIDQAGLDQHFVSIHLGGAKRLLRRGEGGLQRQEVAAGAYSVVPAGSAFQSDTQGPVDFVHIYLEPRFFEPIVTHTGAARSGTVSPAPRGRIRRGQSGRRDRGRRNRRRERDQPLSLKPRLSPDDRQGTLCLFAGAPRRRGQVAADPGKLAADGHRPPMRIHEPQPVFPDVQARNRHQPVTLPRGPIVGPVVGTGTTSRCSLTDGIVTDRTGVKLRRDQTRRNVARRRS